MGKLESSLLTLQLLATGIIRLQTGGSQAAIVWLVLSGGLLAEIKVPPEGCLDADSRLSERAGPDGRRDVEWTDFPAIRAFRFLDRGSSARILRHVGG